MLITIYKSFIRPYLVMHNQSYNNPIYGRLDMNQWIVTVGMTGTRRGFSEESFASRNKFRVSLSQTLISLILSIFQSF